MKIYVYEQLGHGLATGSDIHVDICRVPPIKDYQLGMNENCYEYVGHA